MIKEIQQYIRNYDASLKDLSILEIFSRYESDSEFSTKVNQLLSSYVGYNKIHQFVYADIAEYFESRNSEYEDIFIRDFSFAFTEFSSKKNNDIVINTSLLSYCSWVKISDKYQHRIRFIHKDNENFAMSNFQISVNGEIFEYNKENLGSIMRDYIKIIIKRNTRSDLVFTYVEHFIKKMAMTERNMHFTSGINEICLFEFKHQLPYQGGTNTTINKGLVYIQKNKYYAIFKYKAQLLLQVDLRLVTMNNIDSKIIDHIKMLILHIDNIRACNYDYKWSLGTEKLLYDLYGIFPANIGISITIEKKFDNSLKKESHMIYPNIHLYFKYQNKTYTALSPSDFHNDTLIKMIEEQETLYPIIMNRISLNQIVQSETIKIKTCRI